MKVRLLNEEVRVTPTQIAPVQRCEAQWAEAARWQRSQRPDRSIRSQQPLNTLGSYLTRATRGKA